jgi:hypothetical protein
MTTPAVRAAAGLLMVAAVAIGAAAPAQSAGVDPEALRLLRRMTDYLAALEQFSVDTQNMLEEVLESGQKIQHDVSASTMVKRPNKLRAERKGDLVSQVLFYDGRTLTIYNPTDDYYATVAAPGTLDATLRFAHDSLDIVAPAGDLVYRNAFDLLTANVTSGMVVGKSAIGGVKCDHLAFSGPVVDWQLWIADGDTPLPRKYVVTTKDDPVQPEFIVLINNWNVAPDLKDAMFVFTPPPGAKRTDFLRKDTARTPTRQPESGGTQ